MSIEPLAYLEAEIDGQCASARSGPTAVFEMAAAWAIGAIAGYPPFFYLKQHRLVNPSCIFGTRLRPKFFALEFAHPSDLILCPNGADPVAKWYCGRHPFHGLNVTRRCPMAERQSMSR